MSDKIVCKIVKAFPPYNKGEIAGFAKEFLERLNKHVVHAVPVEEPKVEEPKVEEPKVEIEVKEPRTRKSNKGKAD